MSRSKKMNELTRFSSSSSVCLVPLLHLAARRLLVAMAASRTKASDVHVGDMKDPATPASDDLNPGRVKVVVVCDFVAAVRPVRVCTDVE